LPRQHRLLKGILKSTAAFMLTYQIDKAINNNTKSINNTPQTTNLVPALGISLAAGLPDIVQGLKNKKSYLIYTMYDANRLPITTQKIVLKKQYNSYTFDKVIADGFVKVIILGNGQKVTAGNLNIAISEQAPVSFKGQIAGEFDLNSFGDCTGGGDIGTCEAIASLAFAAALVGYLEESIFCAGLVFPPLIGACLTGATIAYGVITVGIALDLKACLKKRNN
jgi:hypothetical protein